MNKHLLVGLAICVLIVSLCSCAKKAPESVAIEDLLLPESVIPAGWEVYTRDTEMTERFYQQEQANLELHKIINDRTENFIQTVLYYKAERGAKGGYLMYIDRHQFVQSLPLSTFPELVELSFKANEWDIYCYQLDYKNLLCMYNGRYGNYVIHVGVFLSHDSTTYMTAAEFAAVLKTIDDNAAKLVMSNTED